MVVPVDELAEPVTGPVFRGKWNTGKFRSVIHRFDQGFGVRVDVGDPWPRERPEHAKLLEAAFQRGRKDGVAVIGMQDKRLLSNTADQLSKASPAH